jgi:hypothetical protein
MAEQLLPGWLASFQATAVPVATTKKQRPDSPVSPGPLDQQVHGADGTEPDDRQPSRARAGNHLRDAESAIRDPICLRLNALRDGL